MADGPSRNELRDRDIYEKYVRGATVRQLGDEYGITFQRVSEICIEVRRRLPERSREELVQMSLDQLEYLREKVNDLIGREGSPVTAGQLGDVVRDPETGEVVRDYSLRLRAIDQAVKMNGMLAKRLGLDAPAQTESVVKASVQYEIVGIDPEDLT